jgi:hypothetical protein
MNRDDDLIRELLLEAEAMSAPYLVAALHMNPSETGIIRLT